MKKRVTCATLSLCTCVMCHCVITAPAYTSAGPLSLKAKRCFHICHHIGSHRFDHCAHLPHQSDTWELLSMLHSLDPCAPCRRRWVVQSLGHLVDGMVVSLDLVQGVWPNSPRTRHPVSFGPAHRHMSRAHATSNYNPTNTPHTRS